MHLGWNVWFTLIAHYFLNITANEDVITELQGYENLIPYSQLYLACIEQNLQSCEVFNMDDIEKRSPQFNAWGGKRAKFSSWGGKRGSQFSSWGGKRSPEGREIKSLRDSLKQVRAKNYPDKIVPFTNWGGKRDFMEDKRAKFNSWGGKRAPKFSSWGGKRSPELFEGGVNRDKFFTLRKPASSGWGGKGSVVSMDNVDTEGEEYPVLMEEEEDHSIKKRETAEDDIDAHMPDLWKEFFDRISNPNFNKNHPYDQVTTESTIKASPVKKSPADSHLQHLFKKFVYWTGNQPGEKKNTLINSRLYKDLSASPMRRGSPDFFNWGGKRNELSQ
uniref:Kinin n=1 Tax=Cacopsylla melanoneura TaxID=428564 RepID=A0A8D8YIY0_9HEMI